MLWKKWQICATLLLFFSLPKGLDSTSVVNIFKNTTTLFSFSVKPIGIFTHMFMNIFFGTKIPMFLNILIVLGIVDTVVVPPVLK